ncbi:GIY-YIG nuclease family protein [Priestia sp. SB1]|uniref:GIY-YIG nuclease family protein n=1 Tax=Priestia sp. SB1 TaxID=3132359 RepID=UPI00317F37C5
MLTVTEMLKYGGIDTNARIKLARHKDSREGVNLEEIAHLGMFEIYQSYQEKDVFKDCDYVVSFIGEERNQALFVGVYKVVYSGSVKGIPEEYRKHFGPEAKKNSKYRYLLKKESGFESYEKRLVFEWFVGSRSWFRILSKDTDIKSLQWHPEGYVADFPGYDNVILSHIELEKMINNPTGNKVWHDQLSSVKGVYLILDRKTGFLYVGVAKGANGFLGRWREYANDGHGGNVQLLKIILEDEKRKYDFQYSILKVVSSTASPLEILAEEKKYKRKLGTIEFGLNSN